MAKISSLCKNVISSIVKVHAGLTVIDKHPHTHKCMVNSQVHCGCRWWQSCIIFDYTYIKNTATVFLSSCLQVCSFQNCNALFLSFCFCDSASACGSVCGIFVVFLFQRLDDELKAERVDSISVNTALPPVSLQHTGKGSRALPETWTTNHLSSFFTPLCCAGVRVCCLCMCVWERDSKRCTICYESTMIVTIKLVATHWRQFNRKCDASLHIKSKRRNQTPSLTYSTSAQHNIDNGSTTPTSKPLVLVSSLHMHKGLLDVRCNTRNIVKYRTWEFNSLSVLCVITLIKDPHNSSLYML